MSPRAASILAIAAVMSSLCLYATFAQIVDPPIRTEAVIEELAEPGLTDGAIVPGPAPLRLQQELPGRYQMQAVITAGNSVKVALVDTHTGECWIHEGRGWQSLRSPVKQVSSTVRQ